MRCECDYCSTSRRAGISATTIIRLLYCGGFHLSPVDELPRLEVQVIIFVYDTS